MEISPDKLDAVATVEDMALALIHGADATAADRAATEIDWAITNMACGDALIAILLSAVRLTGTHSNPALLRLVALSVLAHLVASADTVDAEDVGGPEWPAR